MKIDMTQDLFGLDGEPISKNDATLRRFVTDALLQPLRGDENLAGTAKAYHYGLALRVHHEDAPDLKSEDIALIKERIGRAYGALVVGAAYALLDPTAPDGET